MPSPTILQTTVILEPRAAVPLGQFRRGIRQVVDGIDERSVEIEDEQHRCPGGR